MDGFPFKGRELIVKAPMSQEERNAIKERKEELASGKDLAHRLRRTKQPTVRRLNPFITVEASRFAFPTKHIKNLTICKKV